MLLEQVFVIDPTKRVKEVIEAAAKELGSPIAVDRLRPVGAGRGLAQAAADDFAAEVAQLAGSLSGRRA